MKKTKRHNINRKRKPELPKHVMTIFQTIILLACIHEFLYLLNLTPALASSSARGGGGLGSL
jgi:hypothetical protein